MLYGICVGLYIFLCLLLATLILVQQSKSSAGIGAFSGQTQMLFGGSGGQDVLQKATWVIGALVMLSSLTLSLWKASQYDISLYQSPQKQQQQQQQQ